MPCNELWPPQIILVHPKCEIIFGTLSNAYVSAVFQHCDSNIGYSLLLLLKFSLLLFFASFFVSEICFSLNCSVYCYCSSIDHFQRQQRQIILCSLPSPLFAKYDDDAYNGKAITLQSTTKKKIHETKKKIMKQIDQQLFIIGESDDYIVLQFRCTTIILSPISSS